MKNYNKKIINGHLLKLDWTNLRDKNNNIKRIKNKYNNIDNYKESKILYNVSILNFIFIFFNYIGIYWQFGFECKRRRTFFFFKRKI